MQDRPVLRLGRCGVVKMAVAHRPAGSGVDAMPFLEGQGRYPLGVMHLTEEALSVSGNTPGYSQRSRQLGADDPLAQKHGPSSLAAGKGQYRAQDGHMTVWARVVQHECCLQSMPNLTVSCEL